MILTFARWNAHSHIFNADVSLMPFLARSDAEMVAGTVPCRARARAPKNEKEEEATPVRMARPNGSTARRMSCWVMDSNGSDMLFGSVISGWVEERYWLLEQGMVHGWFRT